MTNIAQVAWSVNPQDCIGCGDCAAICPVSVFDLSSPPCQTACPINTDVLTYVSLIQQGRFNEALASIRELHPFAGILGRVCTHPCENSCRRCEVDSPVSICALKRAAADYGQVSEEGCLALGARTGKKVAIVGSGSSGLMAAHDLAKLGHMVTVFESLPVVGGMLAVGIPEYRLPKKVVELEVSQIENLGVEFSLNLKVGEEVTLDTLFQWGYEAVLLATGAHQTQKLGISGEDTFEGVVDAISFLRRINLGDRPRIAGKTIVIGGGNAAIDAARTLARLGAASVEIVYRRTAKEIPAISSEVAAAEEEGIKFHYQVIPVKILGENGGRVSGLECMVTEEGEIDASGRRSPVPVPGSKFLIEADFIVSAIGQKPDLSSLTNTGIEVSREGLLVTNQVTQTTNIPGVFAAGDNTNGLGTVIDAMAAGKRAAVSIDRYLKGASWPEALEQVVQTEKRIWWAENPRFCCQKIPDVATGQCELNFKEVEVTMPLTVAMQEAKHCLKCGIFANMDLESCCRETCRLCERHCSERAIKAF